MNDWNVNRYFDCKSPAAEACGVPYTCCVLAENVSDYVEDFTGAEKHCSDNADIIFNFK